MNWTGHTHRQPDHPDGRYRPWPQRGDELTATFWVNRVAPYAIKTEYTRVPFVYNHSCCIQTGVHILDDNLLKTLE